MGFFKKVFKVVKKVAPVAAAFIPGLGPLASAALGAGLGAVSGGGLKGALLGGAGGYLGGAVPGGGTLAGNALARNIGNVGAQTLGKAASGALMGASTGGKQGALLGAVGGGLSANAGDISNWADRQLSGGVSSEDLLNAPANMSPETSRKLSGAGYSNSQIQSFSNGLSSGVYRNAEDVLNAPAKVSPETAAKLSGAGYSPAQIQSFISGSGSLDSASSSNAQAAGGGDSMFSGKKISDILSGAANQYTTNENEDELLKSQRAAQEAMTPYYQAGTGAMRSLQERLQNGFNPGDLTQDPGYQFQLEQGNRNLNRSLGAQGSLFSGRALQAAQDYGQGLAEQTYQNAYNRWLQQNQQLAGQAGVGYDAAGSLGDQYTTYGSTKANANTARSNGLTGVLSSIFGGSIAGWDAQGNPVYADDPDADNKVVVPAGGQ